MLETKNLKNIVDSSRFNQIIDRLLVRHLSMIIARSASQMERGFAAGAASRHPEFLQILTCQKPLKREESWEFWPWIGAQVV